jgi:hypothetical protein
VTGIPTAVWVDHLIPVLMSKDSVRLGATCKALRLLMREHFKDLGTVKIDKLQAALTSFPKAETVDITHFRSEWREGETLVRWLREGGGDCLTKVGGHICDLLHMALRQGALPSLKGITACLRDNTHRASLTSGLLGAMHELRLKLASGDDALAALSLVRQLPNLIKLDVSHNDQRLDPVPQWPPFIPPSLRSLSIKTGTEDFDDFDEADASLLSALPDVVQTSGAALEHLQIEIETPFSCLRDELVPVAQTVRYCSPTLTAFLLAMGRYWEVYEEDEAEAYARHMDRLRTQLADVLAAVSNCPALEVLVLPYTQVYPFFPRNAVFTRLAHLEIVEPKREHPPGAGTVGLWEVVTSGGLPALAKLRVTIQGDWGGVKEVKTRVAPAFKAVADTLTHLYLDTPTSQLENPDYGWWLDALTDVGYELGVAMGKLRRLKDLALTISGGDGRAYDAVAQGLAATGGEDPLPLLWRVVLPRGVETNGDLVARLVLPSVRVFASQCRYDAAPATLTACALRRIGYRHTWVLGCHNTDQLQLQEAMSGVAGCGVVVVEDLASGRCKEELTTWSCLHAASLAARPEVILA